MLMSLHNIKKEQLKWKMPCTVTSKTRLANSLTYHEQISKHTLTKRAHSEICNLFLQSFVKIWDIFCDYSSGFLTSFFFFLLIIRWIFWFFFLNLMNYMSFYIFFHDFLENIYKLLVSFYIFWKFPDFPWLPWMALTFKIFPDAGNPAMTNNNLPEGLN